MSYTTRPCEICGKLMVHVDSRRRICPKCNRELRDKKKGRPKARRTPSAKPQKKQQETPPLKRRVKPITQCVREAEALGISYGRYVQRGYDKK